MSNNEQPQHPRFKEYKWWIRVSFYIIFLLIGQSAATLLGRLYFDKGGNSEWMATFVQSSGFPLLLPIMFHFHAKFSNNDSSKTKSKISTLVLVYVFLGLLVVGDNMMYSYGLLYLPVSTYSLLCGTQLIFNAIFSFFFNSQKFTALIFNSIILLTMSASLLAVNVDSENSLGLSREKYIIGFFCTIGASVAFSLNLSLTELCFEKVIKRKTFSTVLDMQFYTCFVATCASVVGLFASGDWKTLDHEMKEYQKGKVSYIMTLLWTAVSWQIFSLGTLGLIFEVSSLFSNVVGTMALPIVPILAVIFFHDNINGVKVIALLLALWGFLSYIYQHYLDDKKSKANKSDSVEISRGGIEIC
ncbi:PREDICTED: probable purine permease 11 [Lupinus angustifolius]|uniref:probable purine permease 11 n=1 Tax=Lupinus angustifolius TaxID=3871 RepID=UPI00092E8A3D|nr:PREDICTED: probable purine permease 11 [Lupinus angustifolius]